MTGDSVIKTVDKMVQEMISDDPALFLVEVRIKPTNNIKVFIDGDQGVSIDRLVKFNRRIYRQLEEQAIFPGGDFSLEVSSPGLDEPLKLHRQLLKNIGRHVEVVDLEGKKVEGKMTDVNETGIIVEEVTGKGKKMETVQHTVLFDHIKTTKIQIKF